MFLLVQIMSISSLPCIVDNYTKWDNPEDAEKLIYARLEELQQTAERANSISPFREPIKFDIVTWLGNHYIIRRYVGSQYQDWEHYEILDLSRAKNGTVENK